MPARASRAHLMRLLKRDPSLLDRCLRIADPQRQVSYTSSQDLDSVFRPFLAGHEEESFAALAFDKDSFYIDAAILTRGTHRLVAVDTAHVLRWVFTRSRMPWGFAVAHNHPSGDCDPSDSDIQLTLDLQDAAKAVRLEFRDHLIIGGSSYYSFADRGLSSFLHKGTEQVAEKS